MSRWPVVPLGEVLVEQKVRVGTPDADGLPLLGVSNVDGLHRSSRTRIGDMSKYLLVKDRWFAYNPMRINVGSIGWARTPEQTGVISPDYVVFSCTDRVEPRLIHLFLTSNAGLRAIVAETAGSVRERLYFDALSRILMPLPPLEEQRRIVAHIDELAAKVAVARQLGENSTRDTQALVVRATHDRLDDAGWELHRLEEILSEPPRNGLSPKPEVGLGGRPMLRINAVSSSPTRFVDLTAVKLVEAADEECRPFVLQHDDVFIVRYNGDINRVAKPGIYKAVPGCRVVFPDKLMRLRPNAAMMLPDFLVFALGARSVREQILELGKTTAGNIGVSGADARSFLLPVPPLPEQRRIVAHLDVLQGRVSALTQVQAEVADLVGAVVPSVLARVFAV